MPYLGLAPTTGENNNFRILDDITSYTLTFDGSSASVISTSDNTITENEHRFVQGQRVTYNNGGGSNIGGLTSGTVYFIYKSDKNSVGLSTDATDAAAGTLINLSSVGGGSSHTLNVAFDGTNTKFKATYNSGTHADFTRSAQLQLSVNGVIQQPFDTTSPSNGFGWEHPSVIIFSTAPESTDAFWGHLYANNNPTYDIADNKVDTFVGTGSTTDFTLSKNSLNNENLLVTIDGVVQYPTSGGTTRAYTTVDNVIKFTAAPGSGVSIQVRHIGFAGASAGSGGVSAFYGRTGNVTLTSSDNPVIGNLTAVDATFSGNVSIAKTLTYEDVTNIDSVGLITARGDIHVAGSVAHLDDDHTKIAFTENQIDLQTGGYSRLYTNNSGTFVRSGTNLAFLAATGPSPAIKSGGTSNQDLLLTTGTDNPTRIQIASGGNVGIGSFIPGKTLDIAGSLQVKDAGSKIGLLLDPATGDFQVNQSVASWSNPGIDPVALLRWGWKGATGNYMYMGSGGNDAVASQMALLISGESGFKVGRSAWDGTNGDISSSNEFFRITKDGNTGIGTTNPSEKLVVAGHLKLDTVQGTNTDHDCQVLYQHNDNVIHGGSTLNWNPAYDTLKVNSNLISANSMYGAGGTLKVAASNHSSTSYVLITDKVEIGGNVGVGTDNPKALLHVGVGGTFLIGENTAPYVTYPLGTGKVCINHGNSAGNYFDLGGTQRSANGLNKIFTFHHGYWGGSKEVASMGVVTLSNTGGSGWGEGDLVFYTGTSGSGDSGTTSTERLRIDHEGRVGINTTVPADLLSIGAAANTLAFGCKDTTRFNHVWQMLNNDASGNAEFRMYKNSVSGTHEQAINFATSGDDNYLLYGDLGIGVANPTQPLTIKRSSSGQAEFGVRFQFTDTDGPTQTSSALLVGTYGLKLKNYNSSRHFLFETGNVGINTTVPTSPLSFLARRAVQTVPPICFQTAHGTGLADAAISTTDDSGGTDIMMGSNVYMGQNGAFVRYYSSYGSAAVRCQYTGKTIFYNKSGNNDPVESMRIDGDGDVGIGEDNPGANNEKLTVREDIAADSGKAIISIFNLYQGTSGQSNASTGALEFTFKNHNATHNWWGGRIGCFNTDNYNQYTYLRFDTASAGNASGKMWLTHDGKLGIGQQSPDGKLHAWSATAGSVSADADADELVLENSGNVGLSLLTAGTGESSIYFGNPGTNGQKDGWIKYYHETHQETGSRRALSFKTGGGSEKMRLTSGGKIGLGTTVPSGRNGSIDISSNDGSSGRTNTDQRHNSMLTLRNPSTDQHAYTQLAFINGGGTQAATLLRHFKGGSHSNSNYEGDLRLYRRTGGNGGSNEDFRESIAWPGLNELSRQIWWASGTHDTTNTSRIGWHHLSAQQDTGSNQYMYFRLEVGSASYSRPGLCKYTVVWSTGHASGYGYQIGHFAWYNHHTTTRCYVNDHIVQRLRYSTGSYGPYSWTNNPSMEIMNYTQSGGTNAGMVFRCEGNRSSGYDMSVRVALFLDLYVPESANGDTSPRLYSAGNSHDDLDGAVNRAYYSLQTTNPFPAAQPS